MTTDPSEKLGTSRRSFMKAGAAAAGAGAMGWLAFDSVIDEEGRALAQQEGSLALVFAWQFQPGVDFELITEIDDAEEILGAEDDDGVDAVANPDEWDGFVIRYDFSEVPYYGFGFFGQDVNANEGDVFNFSPNASLTSQELSLIQTRAAEAGEETPTPEEETPTPEEETPTPEEETPTPEEGTPEEGTPEEGTPAGTPGGGTPTPVGTPGGGTPTPGGTPGG